MPDCEIVILALGLFMFGVGSMLWICIRRFNKT